MARPGPKAKVDAAAKQKIYACLSVGASFMDAAEYLGINPATLRRAKRKDKDFARGARKAIKAGKLRLLKKMGSAKQWQAAAWMLERRWGKEYGRREIVRQEIVARTASLFTADPALAAAPPPPGAIPALPPSGPVQDRPGGEKIGQDGDIEAPAGDGAVGLPDPPPAVG